MQRVKHTVITIGIGCIIYIITTWMFSRGANNYNPLLYYVYENEFFKHCARSKSSWIKCTKTLNQMNSQNNVFIYEHSYGWPPSSISHMINKRFPAFSLVLHIPFAKDMNNPKDNMFYYSESSENKSGVCSEKHLLTRKQKKNKLVSYADYSTYPQSLNFSKLIYNIQHGKPIYTVRLIYINMCIITVRRIMKAISYNQQS
ncbi:unnamed protein product [Heterobilharzia americana]|nr:unnamed protein product [Heterobilharzia americana]